MNSLYQGHQHMLARKMNTHCVSRCSYATRAVTTRHSTGFSSMRELSEAPFSIELESACKAVRLASVLCMRVQRQLIESEKSDKQDDSPVTVADYGAQAVVAWVLSRANPSVRLSMVAEEDSSSLLTSEGRPMLERITSLINSVIVEEDSSAYLSSDDVINLIDLGDSQGGSIGQHWVLDPIDGTRGFVGKRQYCICLGMLKDGKMELGVLGGPNLPQGQIEDDDGGPLAMMKSDKEDVGSLFLAHRGWGCFETSLKDKEAPLKRNVIKDVPNMSEARVMESYDSRHSSHSFAALVSKEVGIIKPTLRMDSQVKYGLLSRGDEARIFMRFPRSDYREKIWDHAAGLVVVEEAGGCVSDAYGNPLDFSIGRYLDSMKMGIIAAPPSVHQAIVQAITTVRERDGF